MSPAAANFLQVVLNWSPVLAPAVPVALFATRATRPQKRTLLWLAAALFLLDMA